MKRLVGRMGAIGISWLGLNWIGGVMRIGSNGRGRGINMGIKEMENRWWMRGEGVVMVLEDGLIMIMNTKKRKKDVWFRWNIKWSK